jgi:biotin operon repressor
MNKSSTYHRNFQGTRAEIYRLISEIGTYEHPLSRNDLAAIVGMTPREVSRAVESLRRDGMKILASRDKFRGGYWLATSPGEFKSFYATVAQMSLSALKTLSRMNVPEQEPLPLDLDGE